MEQISPDLLQELRAGHSTRERKIAVCAGTVSMPPEVRVELLAVFSGDADEMIARRAAEALLSAHRESFISALANPGAAPALFRYCARELADSVGIADALAKNPSCPAELLVPAARHLTTAGVQALMENFDRLSSAPTLALAAALIASSSLTAEQRLFLQELQQGAGDPAAFEEAVAAAEPDVHRRQTMLQILSRMTVVERVRLAFRGNKEERSALIRDRCKVVQISVLQSPLINDREIESFAAMANLSEDVLRYISLNRKFRKNYAVARNLLFNPKTPVDITLHLLPNATSQDLKLLTTNKNVPETLRTAAVRLFRQRKVATENR